MNGEFIYITYGETVVLINHKKKLIDVSTDSKVDLHFLSNLIERIKKLDGINFLDIALYTVKYNKNNKI